MNLFQTLRQKQTILFLVFASHCIPLDNNSKVPGCQIYITDSKLSSLQLEGKNIIKIVRSLDTNKKHDISIRMLKKCGVAIIELFSIIFRNCIYHSKFPDLWKKSNICKYKKSDKQVINNYRPVSLLPICEKILERLISNSLFGYLEKYKLLSISSSIYLSSQWFLYVSIAIHCP